MDDQIRLGEVAEGETQAAKDYWGRRGVKRFYRQREQHWRGFIAEQTLAYEPRRVLEFGCNVGQNLLAIRERAAEVELVGIDINADAVEAGRRDLGLDLRVADEDYLARQDDDAFDVVFTVSVFDHLPAPAEPFRQVLRLAPVVLLLEPWVGREGRIETSPTSDGPVDTTPYSYSWDYRRLAADLPVTVESEPYPLGGERLNPYYTLFRIVRA